MGLTLHFQHNQKKSLILNKDLKNLIREVYDPE